MNFMRKTCSKISHQFVTAFVSRSFSSKGTLIAEHLSERSLIRVEGNEVVPFLQGLVTNDMTHFDRGARAMYAMFLNNTGRVLYDSIIYRTGDENVYLVECDKSTCSELRRHLRMFRVRRNIEVDSIGTDYLPWVVFKYNKPERDAALEEVQLQEIEGSRVNEVNSDEITLTTACIDFNAEEVVACQDPRIKALGLRVIMPKPFSYPELSKLFSQHDVVGPSSQVDYKYLRYTLGIGEGVIDHPPNKCFPLEANCDFLHGVSFHKGCYIGQELTARVHHTGVIRKRLMPIKLTKKVDEGVTNVQSVGGSIVGTIRGVRNDAALALLRVEHVFKIPNLAIDGDPCKLMIPDWWPKELPNKHVLQERVNERT